MADFTTAFRRTDKFEGGYCNDENDRGGETYRGIARNFHPDWKGWDVIDDYKKIATSNKEIDKLCKGNQELEWLVESFYKINFWDTIKGDDIIYQNVANNIYDFAVNSGVGRASKYAQRVVGVKDDGEIGKISIKAINGYNPQMFVDRYKENRISFVRKIVENDASQEVFIDGWINRIERC